MKSGGVVFRRIGGRIIPIRAGSSVARGAISSKHTKSKETNPNLKYLSTAAALASGVVSGLTLTGGAKRIFAGQSLSLALDFGSTGMNTAAHAGKGNFKKRAKAALKHEAMNQVLGWGAFGAAALTNKAVRTKLASYASKALKLVR